MRFEELYKHLHSLPIDKKAKLFESLSRKYLLCLDKYNFKTVVPWMQWSSRGSMRDLGIDLVGQKHNGDLVAIQCKCYQRQTLLSKSDVDSFLAFASRSFENKKFSSIIIISTAQGLNDNLEKTIEKQSPACHTILYSDLQEVDLNWSQDDVSKEPPPPLRPYQKLAIKKSREGFQKSNKGQLLMACGTGKTLTSLRLIEEMDVKNVLILVPSLNLISQMSTEYSKLGLQNRQQHHLVVCSDKTIYGKEYDSIVSTRIDVPSTTDPELISRFLQTPLPKKDITKTAS